MTATLCIIFLFSGAAALIFELIWFQLAGIAFGNSVWASAVVLSSFMGGLAIGNGLTAVWGHRIRNPLRFYSKLEISIAIGGVCVAILLPQLARLLSTFFHAFNDHPILLNASRLLISFLLMLIPATAMGATLPVLVKALHKSDQNFGKILGQLYGWNTLGAFAGVLGAELVLIHTVGLRASAFIAAAFNGLAALLAFYLDRKTSLTANDTAHVPSSAPDDQFTPKLSPLLAASFLSGLILLALEVIWFRFGLLFFTATSLNFAIMLSIVLLGISLGGLLASSYFKRRPEKQEILAYLLVANGIFIIIVYANFGAILEVLRPGDQFLQIVLASLFLMFPICLMSGAIYTFIGKFLFLRLSDPTKSAGILTLTNTTGAMLGSAIGGLLLLPLAGVETSFFILSLLYSITSIIVAYACGWWHNPRHRKRMLWVQVLFFASLAIYPFGFMKTRYLDLALPESMLNVEKRIAYKEGLTETIQYLQRELFDRPIYHRLVTNSLSMSGTNLRSRRYMKFYVYLPAALNPSMRDVLLISYGCGSTAKALTDIKSMERMDFVDISKDVFGLSRIVHTDPQQNPVNDPRVNLHVEDGRFFLTTTDRSYDLITAEPPPPKSAGIVNLYTQEYFQLIYDRLKPGGIVTYWLPVYQLHPIEAKAILKGFSNVFRHSSLWSGAELDWMMVGIKSPLPKADPAAFARQWQHPQIGRDMRSLGLVNPDHMGSLFIGDGGDLQAWIGNTPPLMDNYPGRLITTSKGPSSLAPYYQLMDAQACRTRFLQSDQMRIIWPATYRTTSADQFELRPTIDHLLAQQMPSISDLHQCLENEKLAPFILWALRSDQVVQDIITDTINSGQLGNAADQEEPIQMYRHFAARACQERDFVTAEKYLNLVTNMLLPQSKAIEFYYNYRAYLLFRLGKKERARQILEAYVNSDPVLKTVRHQSAQKTWNYLKTLNFSSN